MMAVTVRTSVLSLVLVILASCAPLSKQLSMGPWVGRQAPFLEGLDSSGQPVSMNDYKGKVVLVSFWHSA